MASPSTPRLPMLIAACLAAILGGIVAWWMHLQPREPIGAANVQGLLWPPPRTLRDIALTDQHNVRFGAERVSGKWTLMFFGFTHCPDVCPTTLETLKRALPAMPTDTQVVFVSVDPERDTPEKLASYVAYFHPDFVGLGGEPANITALEKSLGVLAERVPQGDKGEYTMDHSAAVFLIDPRQREVGVISPPLTVESVRQTYAQIRRFVEQQG
jgi:protein SCO1/2